MKLVETLVFLAIFCVPFSTRADDGRSIDQDFTAAIARASARDAQSPDTLSARLAYADFLAKLGGAECHAHLNAAQEQLDLVAASPALNVLVPAGRAHAVGIEYQIHLARADCDTNPETQDRELHAALASALRASDLYRDEFDAVAMATMQFNVALTYHRLGDSAAALAALQSTLDMDRQYGFVADAMDNYEIFLRWSAQPSNSTNVDARMRDFPQRSATLTFLWTENDASVTRQTDTIELGDHQRAHIQSLWNAQRQVRKHLGGWVVSYDARELEWTLEPPAANEGLVQATAKTLTRMLTAFHDFAIAQNGGYRETIGDSKFNARVRTDLEKLKGRIGSMGDVPAMLSQRLNSAVEAAVASDARDAQVAEDYNLEAGTWIGAELKQGVWYPMKASLVLPFAPEVLIPHNIQFSYTRSVPCLPGAVPDSCVEILVHATPDTEAMNSILNKLARAVHSPRDQLPPQFWSVTQMRLITDPKTLQSYRREMRRHSYVSSGAPGTDQSLIEATTAIESTLPKTNGQLKSSF